MRTGDGNVPPSLPPSRTTLRPLPGPSDLSGPRPLARTAPAFDPGPVTLTPGAWRGSNR